MKFIRKSLVLRLLLYLVFFLALLGLTYFLVERYELFDITDVPYYYYLTAMGGLIFIIFMLFWWQAVHPLRIVLGQMQAFVTGKRYRKIYTTRIDEIGVIATFFNQVVDGFSSASHNLQDKERIDEELITAAELQEGLYPLESPFVKGLQVVAKNKPASEVGGDSFNVLTVSNKTFVYVGDVTGHGVAAGLIMTMVNSLIDVFSDSAGGAYDVIVNVNKYIRRHINKPMFMTMVMLMWDADTKKMTYVGAGHEHILIYRKGSGQIEEIESGGIALGMIPDNSSKVTEAELPLEDGDMVILYTDGITEARNPEGELYELERLKNAVIEFAPNYSAEGVNFHVAKDVTEFMKDHKQDDDMTLIVLQRNDALESKPEKGISTSW